MTSAAPACLAFLALSAAAIAQSPLVVAPVAPVNYQGWVTNPPIHTNLFNLTVTQTITLQAIETPVVMPLGAVGNLEIWLTNPGTTTYVGNHTNQGVWSLAASGTIVGRGTTGTTVASLMATSCQATPAGGGLVINPGSYGVLIRYTNGAIPLLVAVANAQTFTNTELSVSGGALQYTPWGALAGALGGQFTSWAWHGNLIYQNGVAAHACANALNYGTGCYTVGGSAYQEWTDGATPSAAAAASAALTGRSLSFIPSGSSYVMIPGTATFVAPTGAATALAAVDDGEASVPLPSPFPYLGSQVATSLFVHSNGYVSVGPNNVLPGGPNFIPEISTMLSANETAWWSWHDYNPAETGSGQIVWEVVGSQMIITWNGVESYPTAVANPSTFQFQFDFGTGQVNIVWQTIEAVGGTGVLQGSDHVIGFSPGGASPETGAFNITTLTSQTLNFPEAFPLALNASAKPLLGTTISLDTSRETGQNVGLLFLSLGQIPAPGIDLGVIGAPGCPALMDVTQGVGNLISNFIPGTPMSVQWPLPSSPAFAAISVYAQSIWLDPAANAFGATTSNGVKLTLGNF